MASEENNGGEHNGVKHNVSKGTEDDDMRMEDTMENEFIKMDIRFDRTMHNGRRSWRRVFSLMQIT